MSDFHPFDSKTEGSFEQALADYNPETMSRQPRSALQTIKKAAAMAKIAGVAVTIGPGELLELVAEIEHYRDLAGEKK